MAVTLADSSIHFSFHAPRNVSPMRARFPFLEHLCISAAEKILDAESFRDAQGRAILRRVEWTLPFVHVAPDGQTLTLLMNPRSSIQPESLSDVWRGDGISISSERETNLELELVLHHGGWRAAVELFRLRIRAQYDLSQYARPDLAWYQGQLVQHFTFLYGREILNLETGEFEIERLLNEGEQDFGGYDGILLWGGYPRIGIDERTQWELYDDLPGGREGLSALARRARERGTRVFIPYLPWDRSQQSNHVHELARLIADIDADGVFLDTLVAMGMEMRKALDAARAGVVFCSEGRPRDAAFELITGSWDQTKMQEVAQGNWSPRPEILPAVDLARFVFPEHRLFVTNRHAMGEDRVRMIQRGFFSGMGWVVWQDVFGLALSWTPREAALLKKCRTLFRKHARALASLNPTPLIETFTRGVYANEFVSEDECLWTLYNETDQFIADAVLQVQVREGFHLRDVWNEREICPDENGRVKISLAAHDVGAMVEVRNEHPT